METEKPAGGWTRRAEAVRLWTPIIVSCCAIGLTVFQAYAIRRHNRLSVAPRLDTRWQYDGRADEIAISLVNVGLGPAVVKSVVLHHNGEELGPSNLQTCFELSRRHGREGDDWDTRCFDPGEEYFMRPGDSVLVFGSRPADPVKVQPTRTPAAEPGSITITADYCSLYDQCWTLDSK